MPGDVNYKPVIFMAVIIFTGFSVAYLVSPGIFTGLGSKFTGSYARAYGYDPDITFEEWRDEYVVTSAVPGIPTISGYYKTSNRYTSPFNLDIGETSENVLIYSDETEFDWWALPQFKDQYPFKYW